MNALDETRWQDGHVDALRKQFLTFELGEDQYGVDILCVQEIKGWEGVREVPEMPAFIIGVIDLRGIIIPVMDLRRRFKLPAQACNDKTVVIIVATRYGEEIIPLGLVVDAVSDVMETQPDDIKNAPGLGAERNRFISGMVNYRDNMVILLDIEKLLNEKTAEKLVSI